MKNISATFLKLLERLGCCFGDINGDTEIANSKCSHITHTHKCGFPDSVTTGVIPSTGEVECYSCPPVPGASGPG